MLDQSDGKQVAFNISVSTVLKTKSGRVVKVSVLVAGAVGAIHDIDTVPGAAAANQLAVIPAVVGVYDINLPFLTGLVYVPGAAQVVAISFN